MGNALFSSEAGSGADRRVTRRRDQRRNQYRMAPFLPSNMLPFLNENSETPNSGLLSQFRMFRGGPSANNPLNNPMDLEREPLNEPETTEAPSSTEAASDSAIQPDSEPENRSRRLPLIVIGLRAPDPASDFEARNSTRNVPSNTNDSPSETSRNDAQNSSQQPSNTNPPENSTNAGTPQQWMIYIVAATLHQDPENPEREETEDEEPVTPVSPTDSIPAPASEASPEPTPEPTADENSNANRSNILSHLFEALQNQRDEMSNEPNPPSPSLNLDDASRIEMPAYMASLLGLISRVRGLNTDRLDGYENLLQLAELLGPARPRNARMEDVASQLPTFVYKNHQIEPISTEEKTDTPSILIQDLLSGTSDKCSICLNEYSEGEELRVLKCKHGFHKSCLDQWLVKYVNSCPICRNTGVECSPSSPTQEEPPSFPFGNSGNPPSLFSFGSGRLEQLYNETFGNEDRSNPFPNASAREEGWPYSMPNEQVAQLVQQIVRTRIIPSLIRRANQEGNASMPTGFMFFLS